MVKNVVSWFLLGASTSEAELHAGLFDWCLIHNWAAAWQNQQSECAPSEDSDQSSLIRVFVVRMKKAWVLTNWAHSEDSDQTGRMPRLIRVFAGRTAILLVLLCRGSYVTVLPEVKILRARKRCTVLDMCDFLDTLLQSSWPAKAQISKLCFLYCQLRQDVLQPEWGLILHTFMFRETYINGRDCSKGQMGIHLKFPELEIG